MTRDYSAKYDQGKTDWSLLPWRAIERAAKIMTFAATPKSEGGKGYGVDSWKTVKGGMFRYWAALCRHMFCRFILGEIIDPETGEPHMAHALCNVMFVCERDLECAAGEMTEEDKKRWYERDV